MYNPTMMAQRSNSFFIQLITMVAWIGLAACVIELYFLIADGKDFLRGFAGVTHNDGTWNNLIKFYGGLGIVCFGIATGMGLKLIAASLIVLFLLGSFGKDFYIKGQKSFTTTSLPRVSGSSVPQLARVASQQPIKTEVRTATQWTTIAQQKGMKQTRHLQAKEVNWCANAGRALNWREQLNCSTKRVWKH